jgi:hypothetical protein
VGWCPLTAGDTFRFPEQGGSYVFLMARCLEQLEEALAGLTEHALDGSASFAASAVSDMTRRLMIISHDYSVMIIQAHDVAGDTKKTIHTNVHVSLRAVRAARAASLRALQPGCLRLGPAPPARQPPAAPRPHACAQRTHDSHPHPPAVAVPAVQVGGRPGESRRGPVLMLLGDSP